MASIVTDYLPLEIKSNPYYVHTKRGYLSHLLLDASKAGQDVYENEYNKLNNLAYARKEYNHITIQEVFKDNWGYFVEYCNRKSIPLRDAILSNGDSMINCRNFNSCYLFYECPNCHDIYVRGLYCHSRFCVSCGKKYRDTRANEISKTCIYAPHRHITWTIAEELRWFFQKYRDLLDELFGAVNDVLTHLIQGKSKAARKRNERLGFMSTLHTFGRDLKFNPHNHTLIAECTIDKNGKRKPSSNFNYDSLRKSFMNQLLKRMYKFLKGINDNNDIDEFFKIKKELYKKNESGFYVHAPQKECKNPNQITKIVNYVCRYAGHPAMNESRIISYSKDTKMIYYYYDPHEDGAIINENDKIGRQYVTESVFDFIVKLIVHIPNKAVHTTRYYGFYANHSSLDIMHQPKLFKWKEIAKMKSNLNWRVRLISSYNYDPLLCHSGATLEIVPDLCYFVGYSQEDV
jgi:hypothetical protein